MKDDLREAVARALYVAKGAHNVFGPWEAQLYQSLKEPFRRQANSLIDPIIARERAAAIAAARPEIERRATAAIVAWLRDDNGRCDCSARSEGECACGAWDDYKQLPLEVIADRIERGEHLPANPLDA